jgi:hypothetical protein
VQGNSKACIDAETLAAWADGGLSKTEAALVEVHLADCERCTAMLATFARTAPETPAPQSLWKRWHLQWLVPVATAATVAALWVLVPRHESPQIATVRSEPATLPQAPAATNSAQPAPPGETQERFETTQREARAARAPSAPAETSGRREEASRAQERLADAQRELGETLAVAPPQAREADRADAKSVDTLSERAAPAAAPASPRPAASAPPATSAESAARDAVSERRAALRAPPIEIVSPDPMTRWRVVGAGQIERTTTGGAQWERAMLPESATLVSGSSPSPSICWLVGRTGAIYVTTDGLRFVRVPFPDRTNFVSIQAIDARRATVVTIDGRTLRTEDQGETWIRIAP